MLLLTTTTTTTIIIIIIIIIIINDAICTVLVPLMLDNYETITAFTASSLISVI